MTQVTRGMTVEKLIAGYGEGFPTIDELFGFEPDDAKLSISEVPKTQVIFKDNEGQFVGTDGFTRACALAINGEFPEIIIPERKSRRAFTLETAIERGLELRQVVA